MLRTAGRPAPGRSMWRRSFRRHASRFAGLSGWFAGGSREERTGLSGLSLPSLGAGEPDPHARQEVDASSVTPADGKPAETKKARYVVALSRVLRSVRNLSRRFALGLLRPQARANLGSAVGRAKTFHNQEQFDPAPKKLGLGSGRRRPPPRHVLPRWGLVRRPGGRVRRSALSWPVPRRDCPSAGPRRFRAGSSDPTGSSASRRTPPRSSWNCPCRPRGRPAV